MTRYMKPVEIVRVLSKQFEISIPTAYRWLRDGTLPMTPIKVGRLVKYLREDVDRVVKEIEEGVS